MSARFLLSLVLALSLSSCLLRAKPRTEAEIDQARRAAYLAKHPETAPEVAAAIQAGRVRQGMTQAEVRASLGTPQGMKALLDPDADSAWTYRRYMMGEGAHFEGGGVDHYQYRSGEVDSILRFKGDHLVDMQVKARRYRER